MATIAAMVESMIKQFIRRLICKHDYTRKRTIHGDERNYARSEWVCTKCQKRVFSGFDDKIGW